MTTFVVIAIGMADSPHRLCHCIVHRGLVIIIIIVAPWHSPWVLCCRHHHPSSIVAMSSLSLHHGHCVCVIHGHCLPHHPSHLHLHPHPRPPCHCHCRPHRLCPCRPRHHRRSCCHGHHIVVVVMLVLVLVPSLSLSINTEGGWWLHYQCKWQGHRHRLSMQRVGGGCVIDAGGRVVVIVC